MIYTITFNPALDYIVRLDALTVGEINRTTTEQILAGGKGINVSTVLHNLGHDNTALGFVAGFTGHEILRQLHLAGCKEAFIPLPNGNSRINVKIKGKEETEINGQGPEVPDEAIATLYEQLSRLQSGDTLVLAGSIPHTLPATMYQDIMAFLADKKVRIVVDATLDLLTKVLPYRPFLIKPNTHELAEIFERSLTTEAEIIACAKKLQQQGARNVLVSMAKDGALLVTETDQVYRQKAPQGVLVNSVGAGDSMVAGFLVGYDESHGDYRQALAWGICAGSASAFSENLATRAEVENLLLQL